MREKVGWLKWSEVKDVSEGKIDARDSKNM